MNILNDKPYINPRKQRESYILQCTDPAGYIFLIHYPERGEEYALDIRSIPEDTLDQPIEAYMERLPYAIDEMSIVTHPKDRKWN